MGLAAWVDGQPSATCDLTDRALHYGDGLFETFAVRAGRPEFWLAHLQRLEQGCRRLSIPLPDPTLLAQEARAYSAGQERAILKLIYTRGSSARGYLPPNPAQPRRIWLRYPWPDAIEARQQQGIAVRVCATRFSLQTQLAGIKHLNRLEQVLARAEWCDPAIGEGLMLTPEGNVVSGTMSNLFCLQHPRLLTPPVAQCGIAGVIRAQVIAQASLLGLIPTETPLTLADLYAADALWLTNSVIHVWPVHQLEQHHYREVELAPQLRARLQEAAQCAAF